MPHDTPADTPAPTFRTALSTEFLDALRQGDEKIGASAAELAGEWRLLPARPGYHLFRQWESRGQGDEPHAFFEQLDTALVFLAALPAAARPALYTLGSLQTQGYELLREGRPEGFLRTHLTEAVPAAAALGAVARSAVGQAALLAAGGPSGLEQVGQLLGRRALTWLVGEEWP